MKVLFASINYWDTLFFVRIFSHADHRLFAPLNRAITHSGSGALYPLVPLIMLPGDAFQAYRFFLAALAAFAIELPAFRLLKVGIRRDRPCDRLGKVEKRVAPGDRFSFPSGHTAAAFVMATLLSSFFPGLAVPIHLWALGVGFSRVYLGVHYPTDVLAGMLLGILSGTMGFRLVG